MSVFYVSATVRMYLIPFTDWESNAHSMTVQRGQNVHYVPMQSVKGSIILLCFLETIVDLCVR